MKDLAIQFPTPGDSWWDIGIRFVVQSVNPQTGNVLACYGPFKVGSFGRGPWANRIRVLTPEDFVKEARHYQYSGNRGDGKCVIPLPGEDSDDPIWSDPQ